MFDIFALDLYEIRLACWKRCDNALSFSFDSMCYEAFCFVVCL